MAQDLSWGEPQDWFPQQEKDAYLIWVNAWISTAQDWSPRTSSGPQPSREEFADMLQVCYDAGFLTGAFRVLPSDRDSRHQFSPFRVVFTRFRSEDEEVATENHPDLPLEKALQAQLMAEVQECISKTLIPRLDLEVEAGMFFLAPRDAARIALNTE